MNKSITPLFPILASACILLLLSFGYRSGFGLFLQPMSEARGWGRDVLSLALATQNLFWGIVAVFAGGIADKYGNLRVLLFGVFCYAGGMWAMAYSTSEWEILSSAGLLIGAGIAGTSFGIVLPAIVRAVPEERRAWALGLGTASGSFGQFLMVPVMQGLIDLSGWFQALQLLSISALAMALLAIPLAPYGGPQQENKDQVDIPLTSILKRALGVRSYILLISGFFVCGFHVAFITVHMPGYIVDLGFEAKVGAWSISLIGLFNVIGAYFSGVLSGKRPMRVILTYIYLGRAIAISLFLIIPISLSSILLFSAFMGLLWLATVPPTSGLVMRFFGTRYMTFLYGFVFFSHQLGSFTGVWLGGYLYEQFGHYQGIWLAGIVLSLIAAFLHWPIREQDHSERLHAM